MLLIGGGAALALPLLLAPAPRLVWNVSASAPTGLYVVAPGQDAQRGDMVVARLPSRTRALADSRHYVPATVPVVKRIAAAAGDWVCTQDSAVLVNDVIVAYRLRRDSRSRPLPQWNDCRALRGDEILLLADHPDSFDGRYFGPVARASLIGTARLIWAR